MAAAAKIAEYQPEVYELKLSLDMNGKILGRLFHFTACFQLRLFHTCEKRGKEGRARAYGAANERKFRS